METKQVQHFNSNKVTVNLNARISSSKCVFAKLNEIDRNLFILSSSSSSSSNSIEQKIRNLNCRQTSANRKVQNVNSIISICDMIKYQQRPQRRKQHLKRFYACRKPISMRDFFNHKNDAIKGHSYEIEISCNSRLIFK